MGKFERRRRQSIKGKLTYRFMFQKIPIISILTLAAFLPVWAQQFNSALNKELLTMEKADQDARMECVKGTSTEQIECLAKISKTIDAPNTKRLEAISNAYGFPSVKLVGKDGFSAFMLLLQHSLSDDLREKCLKPVKKAFERKDLSPLEYPNFTDRLRVHQGKEQVYGSNFDLKDGKLVMSKTVDPKNLDRRRAKIGLLPISEYAKVLGDLYHLPVEIPRN
jgi:hypothetical protein